MNVRQTTVVPAAQYNSELHERLTDYNRWVTAHPIGTPYPGYPSDSTTTPKPARAGNVKSETVKGNYIMSIQSVGVTATRLPKQGTKQAKAIELLRGKSFATKADKQAAIDLIVSELGMSKAGATTYAYNAHKMLQVSAA